MLKTKPIRFNRIIAMLLSLIMLFGVLPFSASAEDNYGIEICGVMLTPSNYEELLEEYLFGQIAYDPPTNTLTFSGFTNRSMIDDTPVVLYHGTDTVNVVLKWGNNVSGIFFESENGSIAFSAESTGSLGFGKSKDGQTGIRCARMDVNGGTIRMTNFTNGIKANSISVTGGNLVILSDDYHASTAERAISANEMRVSGGMVYACGYSDGLEIGDSLLVSGGDVIVEDATSAVSAGDVGIYGTGVLNVEGDAVGIEAKEVSVTGSAELHAKTTAQGGNKLAIIAHGYLYFDKNTHFIKKPVSAKIAAHPEGETVFEGNGNGTVATEVSIVPWIACSVSRNGGAEERVEWSFENKKVNLFQCPVGETVTVRLVSYDEYGTFDTTVNGMRPHAQAYVTETVSGKSEKSFTFSPEDRIESEVPTINFGQPSGARNQFSHYHNIVFKQLGSSRQVGVLAFETLKGDLTFDEITTQTADIKKMHTIQLSMNDSRGNPVVPSKDGAPNAEDIEVKLTGDKIFSTYIVKSFDDRYVLYLLPGAAGTATVTVSFKGNMSYNPAQITFSVVCQCNDCADGANDSALTHHIATDSTCKVRGNDEYWECGNCGALYGAKGDDGKRPLLAEVPYRPLNPDNHTNPSTQDNDPAWCDRTGSFTGYCNDCNKSIQKTYEINPNHHYAHRFEEVQGRDATCTQPGTAAHYACSACGGKYTKAVSRTETDIITSPEDEITDTVIPAKGHKWVENAEDKYLKSEADCENPAVYYKSCEHCGISTKELYDLRAAAANFTPGSAETVTIDGVEFYILAVDDGKALLLTKDVETFSTSLGIEWDSNKWMDTGIRTYLNGEWLAGKPVLKNLVKETEIKTRTPGAPNSAVLTRDKVFLLSEADVFDTVNGIFYAESSAVDYTYNGAPFIAPGRSWVAYNKDSGSAYMWALRSPGETDHVHYVANNGSCKSFDYKRTGAYGVRPAMWVRFADPDPTPEWQVKIENTAPGAAETVTIDGVEFNVLAKDAAKGRALLLTKRVLFNEDHSLVFSHDNSSWADSLLRDFMNGTHAKTEGGSRFFYPDQAPTLAQYAQKTEIYTPAGYDRTEFVTTRDTFFLLSEADLLGTQNDVAVTDPRYYTYNGKLPAPGGSWIATSEDRVTRNWWLRSPRHNQYSVAQVLYDGALNSIEFYAYDYSGIRGVRPAVWIQYKEPIPEPTTFTYGEALGHDWGAASYDWSYARYGIPKGCTASHTCKRCDHTETEDAEFTSLQTEDPTCTAQGVITYIATFTKAGFKKSHHKIRLVAKLEHSWGETVDAKYLKSAADCTNAAVYYKSCKTCGEKHNSETFEHGDALGHDWGAASYTWGPGNSTCTAQRTCTRDGCPHGEFGTATVTSEQTKDPTCTAQGQITYTARFTNPAFATQYKYVNVAKLEHDWGETVDAKYLKSAADCTNAAVYYKSCKTCGEKHNSETFTHGDALGHLFGKPAYSWETLRGSENRTCTAKRECERKGCDHFEEEKATVSVAKTTDPTCTEKGQYTYTAAFKNTAFETQYDYSDIPELGHEWVEKAEDEYLKTPADCTNAAVYYKSCSRCDEKHNSYTFVHGEPLGHKWVNMVDAKYLESAATCTNAAVYFKSCEHCNIKHDTDTFNNGDPLGHDYGDWYVVVKATDRQKGLKRHDCTREGCEHFETSETDMVEYKLELEESDGGKTTVEPADPQSGDGVKITVEPEEDKRVKEITVTDGDGNQIEITDNGNGEYEFTMPEGDVKIVVEYEPKPAATVDENEGGKTKLEPEYPDAGDEVKITVTPEEDKRVKEITVTDKDGNKIDVTDKGNGEYEFTMPEGDVKIVVEYEPKPTVTVDENEGGKTVIGPKHPDTGDEVDFTVTPEDGKKIKEITVTDEDGNKIDVTDKGNGGYVFTMPDSDVTIEVVYESIVKPSPEIPQTGDNSKLLLWLMLMCISGIGVIATSLKGKKRKYNS